MFSGVDRALNRSSSSPCSLERDSRRHLGDLMRFAMRFAVHAAQRLASHGKVHTVAYIKCINTCTETLVISIHMYISICVNRIKR